MRAAQRLFDCASEALQAGKTVMIAIRGLHATPILGIEVSADGQIVTLACPANDEMGIPAAQLMLRAEDVLGVSVTERSSVFANIASRRDRA